MISNDSYENQRELNNFQRWLFSAFCLFSGLYLATAYAVHKLEFKNDFIDLKNIESITEWLLISTLISASIYTWYLEFSTNQARQQGQIEAYKVLFTAITSAIADYILKAINTSKNIFYYPIGVDGRVFKKKYRKIEYSFTQNLKTTLPPIIKWEIKDIENKYYSPFKIWMGTLCLMTFAIAFWVAHSVAKTFFPFISDMQSLAFYTIALSVSVFFCDVAIIRASTRIYINKAIKKSDDWFVASWLFVFRLIIVISTAALLAFSFSIPFLQSSLNKKLQQTATKEIYDGKEISDLNSERNELATALYALQAKRYCTNFSISGIKNNPVYKNDNFRDILNSLPSALAENKPSTVTVVDIKCDQFLNLDEPPCKTPNITDSCPNAMRLAREVFAEALPLVGDLDARSAYNLGNIARFFPRPAQQTSQGRVLDYKNKISLTTVKLSNAAKMTVNVSLENSCNITPIAEPFSLSGIIEQIKRLVIPAPFRCVPSTPTNPTNNSSTKLDLNTAAGVFFEEFGNIFTTSKGMWFVVAVVSILSSFELLVIVHKKYGHFNTIEEIKTKALEQYSSQLQKGDPVSNYPILDSELEFSTDWSIIEHLYYITTSFINLCKTYMVSPLNSFAIMLIPGIIFVKLLKGYMSS